jgi:hypothetical protein
MDELFWGRNHEDVNDWVERLIMEAKVRDLINCLKLPNSTFKGRPKNGSKS